MGLARVIRSSVVLVGALSVAATSNAATFPTGFTEAVIASGLAAPTAMAIAPDGRIFVCEQGGRLRVVKNGALLSKEFLKVTVDSSGERGLLGVAFDPTFATAVDKWVYIYYTVPAPAGGNAHNRVSRFKANGDVAVPGSEDILMELNNLSTAQNHNGGALHFGPVDGKLYIAVGENANGNFAQSFTTRLGKILRINKDGTIPPNPFDAQTVGVNGAIWAMGLRNPFTFSFQPGSGVMFINDVGQNTWEEINLGVPGGNYGWPATEGDHSNPNFERPIHFYGRNLGCAITGGTFYNPDAAQFPSSYVGKYFFADFCGGWIRVMDPANNYSVTGFATGLSNPVDLLVNPDEGSLYYLQRGSGRLVRVAFGAAAPSVNDHPDNVSVAAGGNVTFVVGASGTGPLRYQWQRNGTNIPSATSSSYTLTSVQLADSSATFRAVVTNDFGSATSNSATLTVNDNTAPVAVITQPAAGSLYTAGQAITFSGQASDSDDGNLPPGRLTWKIDFHHDTHFHPGMQPTSGITGGTFTPPTQGETSANVWYRIYLTAVDSEGLSHTTFRDVHPRKARITLATSPGGLQVTLDGQPTQTSVSITSVVGIRRTLGVVSPQSMNSQLWQFVSWSDAGTQTHVINTPSTDQLYTAVFQSTGLAPGTGTGLSATYFDNKDFTGTTKKRTDPVVNFDWGSGAPIAGIAPESFSVRWTGQVEAEFTETYTFYTHSNDGVRLFVNGTRIINNWTSHSETENAATVALVAGRKYDIKMEYFEGSGRAVARLLWSSASTPKEVIPQDRLYPTPGSVKFARKVNFQPSSAAVPAGYIMDAGGLYALRNGVRYGWNKVNTSTAADRNSGLSPDQRYDTLLAIQLPPGPNVWEMQVPNGLYTVKVVAGDAASFASTYKIDVEGVLTVNGVPSSGSRWVEGTQTVTVSDGRLTITNGVGAVNNKICFVEIAQQ